MRWSCQRLHGCVRDGGQADADAVGERAQLCAPLAELLGRLGERLAAAGAHLGLRGDQLADEMRLDLRAPRRVLQVLEAVDELEGRRVEQRELLLDGEREVRRRLEGRARRREQLLVADLLLLAHARKPSPRRARATARPRAASPSSARRRPARRGRARGARRPAARAARCSRSRSAAGVAVRERDEPAAVRRILERDSRRDLRQARVVGDDRRHARGGGLRGDHPERLGEDRRDDGDVDERQQVREVAVLERAGEERPRRRRRLERLRGSRRSRRSRRARRGPASPRTAPGRPCSRSACRSRESSARRRRRTARSARRCPASG